MSPTQIAGRVRGTRRSIAAFRRDVGAYPRMVQLFSNPASVARGEPSIAAIAETLIATTISLFIAIYYNTLVHIAVAACVAPFLLLRSKNSTKLGLFWFDKCLPKKPASDPIVEFLVSLRTFFLSLVIRIAATARYCLTGIPEIPRNWTRSVFCTDSHSPVEFVPGSGDVKQTIISYSPSYDKWFIESIYVYSMNAICCAVVIWKIIQAIPEMIAEGIIEIGMIASMFSLIFLLISLALFALMLLFSIAQVHFFTYTQPSRCTDLA